ncbi:hypothetical protein LUZ60_005894 [Juncus effusus]|nr:hypothetical protein LUZ60_005894 [Juncus effusus]
MRNMAEPCLKNIHEHSATSATTSSECEVSCWGCGLRLILESYSPVFKCGWCGAITRRDENKKRDSWLLSHWRRVRDRLFTAVLLFFILFVISGGVWAVYPILFSTSTLTGIFHMTIATILSISTLSTFCMAAFKSAGRPPGIIWGSYPSVGKDGLENNMFCIYCERPKPPRAHHCRSCRMCVMDMDHHCPFIGNCVGSANHLSFVLFLISVIISCTYVTITATYCGFQVWPPLDFTILHSSNPISISTLKIIQSLISSLASTLLQMSPQGIILIYLAFASLSVEIGIAVLLWQQLSYIYQGNTYLNSISINTENNAGYDQRGWKNIVRFFECPYFVSRLFWFLGFGNPGKSSQDGGSSSKVL